MKMNPVLRWQFDATGDIDKVVSVAHKMYPVHEEYMKCVSFDQSREEEEPESVRVDCSMLQHLAALIDAATQSNCQATLYCFLDEGKLYEKVYQFGAWMRHDNFFQNDAHSVGCDGYLAREAVDEAVQSRIRLAIDILTGEKVEAGKAKGPSEGPTPNMQAEAEE